VFEVPRERRTGGEGGEPNGEERAGDRGAGLQACRRPTGSPEGLRYEILKRITKKRRDQRRPPAAAIGAVAPSARSRASANAELNRCITRSRWLCVCSFR